MNIFEEKMPRLVTELHAQFVEAVKQLHSLWESLGEGAWRAASIAMKANLQGLGYGG